MKIESTTDNDVFPKWSIEVESDNIKVSFYHVCGNIPLTEISPKDLRNLAALLNQRSYVIENKIEK